MNPLSVIQMSDNLPSLSFEVLLCLWSVLSCKNYSSSALSVGSLSEVSVTCGQPRSETIRWKTPKNKQLRAFGIAGQFWVAWWNLARLAPSVHHPFLSISILPSICHRLLQPLRACVQVTFILLNNGPRMHQNSCWKCVYAKGNSKVLSVSEKVNALDFIRKENKTICWGCWRLW